MISATRQAILTQAVLDRTELWAANIEYFAYRGDPREGTKTPGGRLVNPPEATVETQRRYAQLVMTAAERLHAIKPEKYATSRVVGFLGYPDLFNGGVDVFFDSDHWRNFIVRDDDKQTWTRLDSHHSLAARLDFRIPGSFEEHGYQSVYRYDASAPAFIEQFWLYSERLNSDPA